MAAGAGPEVEARRLGRPPLPPEDRRSGIVDVRVSRDEAATIQERAAQAGLRVREYMRRAALGVRIVAPPDPVTLAHASRLVQVGRLLARVERLAIAGRIVGLPPQEIAELRHLAEAAAVAVLRSDAPEEGESPPCSR